MGLPTTREEFKQFCLRSLGKPAIEINVTNEQAEDRIDEALRYWNIYHHSGSRHTFLSHEVTATDKANRYLTIPEDMFSVTDIFDIGDSTSTNNMFNIRYQLSLNDIFDTAHFRMSGYYMAMMNIALLEEMMVGKTRYRFNQHTDRVYIDEDWNRIVAGTYIVLEGYDRINPDTWPDAWTDEFLFRYTTALIKRQWGNNTKKFKNIQMLGGVEYSGQEIYDEADEEIKSLRDEMNSTHSLPVLDMII